MTSEFRSDFYVYVYIDPRNFEEFYFGKGVGSRKNAHLSDEKDTGKTKRIKEIQSAGLVPTIKVIAKGLTESEAFLIEKTLIWKLGKNLTNISSGHFAEKFRPHNTMHLPLAGFDYRNDLYLVNVAEGPVRCWADCKKYGFLSAGQDKKWSRPIKTLESGDLVIAYLKDYGYIGVGKVKRSALAVLDFRFDGKSLRDLPLEEPNIFANCENENTSEFLVPIEWIKTFNKTEAKWKPKHGLFTTRLVKASLQGQPRTVAFVEEEFGLSLMEMLKDD